MSQSDSRDDSSSLSPSHKMRPVDLALEVASQGYKVFPWKLIRAQSPEDKDRKVPFEGTRGHLDASDDPEIIRGMWKEHPGGRVGYIPGPNVIGIDLDLKNGVDGFESFASWQQLVGESEYEGHYLPTLNNGAHLLYRAPGHDLTVGKNLLPGVDFRAASGWLGFYGGDHLPGRPDELPEASRSLLELCRSAPVALVQPFREGEGGNSCRWEDLSPHQRDSVRLEVAGQLDYIRKSLLEAVKWPDSHRDDKGRGWDELTKDSTYQLACLVRAGWNDLTAEEVHRRLPELVPPEIDRAIEPHARKKFDAGLRRAGERGDASSIPDALLVEVKVEGEVEGEVEVQGEVEPSSESYLSVPVETDDFSMAQWFADVALKGQWLWSPSLGWVAWDGRRWKPSVEEELIEVLDQRLRELPLLVVTAGLTNTSPYLKWRKYAKAKGLAVHLRGKLLADAATFDSWPWLLNVWNGVVDLRDGSLSPHDPELRLTRITIADYQPGARHPDWDKSCRCLSPEVLAWMQLRVGQAATGLRTPDDVLPIGQGGGSNGKTTWLGAIVGALGEHCVSVPDKLLLGSNADHPTELMTLRGARMAVIDETPEAGHLNVARLKRVLGGSRISARKMRTDFVEFDTTHSLFVMTNYRLQIAETDHGTWRRLALVHFGRKFPSDPPFRSRVEAGSAALRSAVLAWIVEGAVRWYGDGKESFGETPAEVVEMTRSWRHETDLVLSFVEEEMDFDLGSCVLTGEVSDRFSEFLKENRHAPWGHKLVMDRFQGHDQLANSGVTKRRDRLSKDDENVGILRLSRTSVIEPLSNRRPWVLTGLAWKSDPKRPESL